MHIESIRETNHPMYEQARELYRQSFPHHEQREALSQQKILSDQAYHYGLIYDEETFVGLALFWATESFIYIEHLCIRPELRNNGYGQKLLNALSCMGKTLILEIDPPVDEISMRRKGFYERCGFIENPYPHVHPPYHMGIPGHELVVMTCPESISEEQYDIFNDYLQSKVMETVEIQKDRKRIMYA